MTLPYGHHVRGAAGQLTTINTVLGERTRIALHEAVLHRSLLVISGPVGTGKSFATARAAEAVLDDLNFEMSCDWLDLPRSIQEHHLLVELYVQLLHVEPPRHTRSMALRYEIARALSTEPRLLVVDEAQHASQGALQTVRWFFDRPDANFALVLVGNQDLWNKLAPELRSRCMSVVRSEPIQAADIARMLRQYDPIFHTVKPGVLRRLNSTRAHGTFRWWAQFLLLARLYAPQSDSPDELSDELIEAVLAGMP